MPFRSINMQLNIGKTVSNRDRDSEYHHVHVPAPLTRQQVLACIVFSHDPGQQVRWVGITLLSLLAFSLSNEELSARPDHGSPGSGDRVFHVQFAIVTVLDVSTSQLFVWPRHSWFSTAVWISLISTWLRPCIAR